jgi:pimeloyl-ACP methyl ester carboxylesterase
MADGTVVTPVSERGGLLPGVEGVLLEWAAEDVVLGRVTSTDDRETQLRILRPYLAAMPKTNAALRRWVADTKAVLDQLKSLPAGSPAGRLGAKADLARVGVFGHAFGGIVAGQFCVEDPRCRAGLNLDGSPQYGTMIDKPLTRPFLMVYSDRDGRPKSSAAIYERSASTYFRARVDGTLLADFTDMPFWRGPLRGQGIFGSIAPQVALDITRRITREFFDQELLGRPSSLLAGKQKWVWEQVSVEVHRPARK